MQDTQWMDSKQKAGTITTLLLLMSHIDLLYPHPSKERRIEGKNSHGDGSCNMTRKPLQKGCGHMTCHDQPECRFNLRKFVWTTVILAPGACRTQGMACFGWMRLRWIHRIGQRIPGGLILRACTVLQQLLLGIQGPFLLKLKNSLGGGPGRGLGNCWDCLEDLGLQTMYIYIYILVVTVVVHIYTGSIYMYMYFIN